MDTSSATFYSRVEAVATLPQERQPRQASRDMPQCGPCPCRAQPQRLNAQPKPPPLHRTSLRPFLAIDLPFPCRRRAVPSSNIRLCMERSGARRAREHGGTRAGDGDGDGPI